MSLEGELFGFSRQEAERVVKSRVCAQDWNDLTIVEFDGELNVQVICTGCGRSVEVSGHISRNTPGIIMENARYAFHEVRNNLRDIFPDMKRREKVSQEAILSELGF